MTFGCGTHQTSCHRLSLRCRRALLTTGSTTRTYRITAAASTITTTSHRTKVQNTHLISQRGSHFTQPFMNFRIMYSILGSTIKMLNLIRQCKGLIFEKAMLFLIKNEIRIIQFFSSSIKRRKRTKNNRKMIFPSPLLDRFMLRND